MRRTELSWHAFVESTGGTETPHLLELSFLKVLALPNDSRRGFADKTRVDRSLVWADPVAVTVARYCMISFVASVLPAPDSPEIMMD